MLDLDHQHRVALFRLLDLETKLPIRWASWDNTDFKGEPWSEWTLIEYNPKLSGNTFKFKIQEDATVIKE